MNLHGQVFVVVVVVVVVYKKESTCTKINSTYTCGLCVYNELVGWFGIALRPQTPKHIRGGWSHYTDTSEPVDGGVL
jgi:hypothetical protein